MSDMAGPTSTVSVTAAGATPMLSAISARLAWVRLMVTEVKPMAVAMRRVSAGKRRLVPSAVVATSARYVKPRRRTRACAEVRAARTASRPPGEARPFVPRDRPASHRSAMRASTFSTKAPMIGV